jgi:hypothetical protein
MVSGSETERAPVVSIVLETTTEQITGRRSVTGIIVPWIEGAEAACSGRWEIVVASASLPKETPVDPRIRLVSAPGLVYYGLKNAGFNAARGAYVLFSDADCRPGEGYVGHALRAFEATGAVCLAGRSFYDGGGLGARIHSAVSFGEHHRPDPRRPLIPLSHNVALRRNAFARDPFGPYVGRTGGDVFLALALYRMGALPVPVPGMVIYHEDRTLNVRATLDRHLREAFDYPFLRSASENGWSAQALKGALLGLPRHVRQFLRYRSVAKLGVWTLVPALVLQALFVPLDLAATALILAVPSLRRRWARYNFGRSEEALRTFLGSPEHSLRGLRWDRVLAELEASRKNGAG